MIFRPMNIFLGLIGVCAILLGGGMECATKNVDQLPQVTITDKNADETIQMQPGQQLIVRLPANPSTGYAWSQVDAPGKVLKVDAPSSFEQIPAGESPSMVGTGGTEIFTFVADSAGQQTLKMEYKRPWETDVPPAKTVSFNVSVV